MIYFSLVFSGIFLFVCNGFAGVGTRKAYAVAGLAACVGILFGCLPAVAFQCFLMLAVAAGCGYWKARYRSFLIGSLLATILAYGWVSVGAWMEVSQWVRLQKEYPMESIADRLAYVKQVRKQLKVEATPHAPLRGPSMALSLPERPEPALSLKSLAKKLEVKGAKSDSIGESEGQREYSLRHLHWDVVEHFINSPGFGVMRAVRPPPGNVEIHDLGLLPLPQPRHSDPPEPDDANASYLRALPAIPREQRPTPAALEQLHEDGLVDFLNPKRYGLIESRERVIGFRPHQFAEMPQAKPADPKQRRWRVERLELVSLLKHEQPAVYVSEHLPRMDELRHAPTRPLDAFEKRALPALQRGEDLQVEHFRDQLRMLGALRALGQCVRCHEAEAGDMLGAFSYVLRPVPEKP